MSRARYPSRAAVGAYYVVAEALANVAKHAHASSRRRRAHPPNPRTSPRVEVPTTGRAARRRPPARACKGLGDRVDALGGRLRLESPPGGGSVPGGRAPMRVILVDDAALVREGIARLLTDAGIEVVAQLPDTTYLLVTVQKSAPHVVILDVRLPSDVHGRGPAIGAGRSSASVPGLGVWSPPSMWRRATPSTC